MQPKNTARGVGAAIMRGQLAGAQCAAMDYEEATRRLLGHGRSEPKGDPSEVRAAAPVWAESIGVQLSKARRKALGLMGHRAD